MSSWWMKFFFSRIRLTVESSGSSDFSAEEPYRLSLTIEARRSETEKLREYEVGKWYFRDYK